MTDFPTSPETETLLPCPLCQSTDVQPGVCYVDGSSTREDAARCGNCGCRATKRAWQARGRAQTPADATQRAIAAVSKVVSSRDDLGNVHFVLLSDAIITALSDTSTGGNSK